MKDLKKGTYYYISEETKDYQFKKLLDWLKFNDWGWEDYTIEDFKFNFSNSYLYFDGDEWTTTNTCRLDSVCVTTLFSKSGWYCDKRYSNWLMFHDFESNKYYGFKADGGSWFENSRNVVSLAEDSEPATIEEVFDKLVKEATKRGFRGEFNYDEVYNKLWCDGTVIFSDGVWAEPTHNNLKPLFEGLEMLKEAKEMENKKCYYFYHSEKHGPNFYTKEELPFHDGEDWKEDLVVYTQLGSGKKFITTKERFKKFKEVWI